MGHVAKVVWWDNAALLRQLAYWARSKAVLDGMLVGVRRRRQFYVTAPTAMLARRLSFWESQVLSWRRRPRQAMTPGGHYEGVRQRIDELQPHVVVSLGSFAERFFRYLADRGLSVATPRVWMYGGDMLSQSGRALIEQRFGCRVHSNYHAVETQLLGFECEQHHGFHLNTDLCAVRLVDSAGRTVAPGEPGELIVSVLVNPATVLLNYRLGDRGVLAAAPCPCGRTLPLLERLEGKTTDFIQLPDGREISTLLLESRMARALDATLQHQVVIAGAGRLVLRAVPFSSVDREALLRAFRELTNTVLGPGVQIEVELVDAIAPTPTGKQRRVVPFPDPLLD
jgi:phenylacetate-CoA ligase